MIYFNLTKEDLKKYFDLNELFRALSKEILEYMISNDYFKGYKVRYSGFSVRDDCLNVFYVYANDEDEDFVISIPSDVISNWRAVTEYLDKEIETKLKQK